MKRNKTKFWMPIILEIDSNLPENEQERIRKDFIRDMAQGRGRFRVGGGWYAYYQDEITQTEFKKTENHKF